MSRAIRNKLRVALFRLRSNNIAQKNGRIDLKNYLYVEEWQEILSISAKQ